jgi:hypothetical protein
MLLPLTPFCDSTIVQELLTLRRLGKTHLTVKPGQIGTSNATKPENLGPFEYAHLRAPLPKDLSGSEIFPAQTTKQDTYFLMVSLFAQHVSSWQSVSYVIQLIATE